MFGLSSRLSELGFSNTAFAPDLPHTLLPSTMPRHPHVLLLLFSSRIKKKLAGHAAVAHEQAEALRQQYKQQFKTDPFEAAERQERAAQRRLQLRLVRNNAPQQQTVAAPPAPAPQAAPAPAASAWGAAPAATGAFGAAPAAPAAASAFGGAFGKAPAPATGGLFGSTPAPAATGFSFGAPAAAPAPATTGGVNKPGDLSLTARSS